jgi:hypothetical protein
MVSTNGWPFWNVPACLLSVYPTHLNDIVIQSLYMSTMASMFRELIITVMFAIVVMGHTTHTNNLLIVASGAFTSTALNGYVHARDRTSGPGKLVSSTSKPTRNKGELHVTGSCEKPSKKSRRNTPTCSNFTVYWWFLSGTSHNSSILGLGYESGSMFDPRAGGLGTHPINFVLIAL